LQRIINYRIFEDESGRMNLNLQQAGGQLLLVSQFTLAANTNSGNRPSFTPAAEPVEGRRLFDYLLDSARNTLGEVPTGSFGAHMQVSLINDGPVTFNLRVPPV
jgi:D-tyrosyl-tRNA(Tyr) deacylase